jgi:hypothetical protein
MLRWIVKYFNPDWELEKFGLGVKSWPWPKQKDIEQIKFRQELNKVLESSAALDKSIKEWNNKFGDYKR